MRVLVTGATGFLGSSVVDAFLGRGHSVRAVVRPRATPAERKTLDLVRLDLRSPDALEAALAGVDVVVHAAGVKSGDFHTQFAGNVSATENLMVAMERAGVGRAVVVSSFSVYDYERMPKGATVDEGSPLPAPARARDAYAATKLLQEQVVQRAARAHGLAATIVRPGAIYGPGHLWTARLGYQAADTWACVGSRARLPLTYVRNCADAIAHLTEQSGNEALRLVNIVDDNPPTQREYREQLLRRFGPPRRLVVLPWPVVHTGVRFLDGLNRVLGTPLQLPGALRSADAVARWRPMNYSNQLLSDLGWRPIVGLAEALDECARLGERNAR